MLLCHWSDEQLRDYCEHYNIGWVVCWTAAAVERFSSFPENPFMADVNDPTPALISDTDVDQAVWREDGQLIGLGRGGNDGSLDLRLVGSSGSAQHLLELPLGASNVREVLVEGPAILKVRNRLLLSSARGAIAYIKMEFSHHDCIAFALSLADR